MTHHPSANYLWQTFIRAFPVYKNYPQPESELFCDNETDANACLDLVLKGIKRATATSLWWFKKHAKPLPKPGDLLLIANWQGEAKAVIRTTKIEIVPFNEVSEAFAQTEGEGDGSLTYWKKVHWDYYTREMMPYAAKPEESMPIVCEYFERLWPKNNRD